MVTLLKRGQMGQETKADQTGKHILRLIKLTWVKTKLKDTIIIQTVHCPSSQFTDPLPVLTLTYYIT